MADAPNQRDVDREAARLRAQKAANARWEKAGREGRERQRDVMRVGLRKKLADEIDPERELSADLLEELVDEAWRAHLRRINVLRWARERRAAEDVATTQTETGEPA